MDWPKKGRILRSRAHFSRKRPDACLELLAVGPVGRLNARGLGLRLSDRSEQLGFAASTHVAPRL